MEFASQITCIQIRAWDNFLAQIYPRFIRENKSNLSICSFSLHFQQIKKQIKTTRNNTNPYFLNMGLWRCAYPQDTAFIISVTLQRSLRRYQSKHTACTLQISWSRHGVSCPHKKSYLCFQLFSTFCICCDQVYNWDLCQKVGLWKRHLIIPNHSCSDSWFVV